MALPAKRPAKIFLSIRTNSPSNCSPAHMRDQSAGAALTNSPGRDGGVGERKSASIVHRAPIIAVPDPSPRSHPRDAKGQKGVFTSSIHRHRVRDSRRPRAATASASLRRATPLPGIFLAHHSCEAVRVQNSRENRHQTERRWEPEARRAARPRSRTGRRRRRKDARPRAARPRDGRRC